MSSNNIDKDILNQLVVKVFNMSFLYKEKTKEMTAEEHDTFITNKLYRYYTRDRNCKLIIKEKE